MAAVRQGLEEGDVIVRVADWSAKDAKVSEVTRMCVFVCGEGGDRIRVKLGTGIRLGSGLRLRAGAGGGRRHRASGRLVGERC